MKTKHLFSGIPGIVILIVALLSWTLVNAFLRQHYEIIIFLDVLFIGSILLLGKGMHEVLGISLWVVTLSLAGIWFLTVFALFLNALSLVAIIPAIRYSLSKVKLLK